MSLLPPNATKPEQDMDASMARLSDIPVLNGTTWNPDTIPAHLLPWLAWAMSVDTWNPAWPESVKRQVIRMSFAVHRIKGTIGALELALDALQLDGVAVTEWFQNAQNPYTFWVDVELSTRGLSDAETTEITAVIDRTKNVRSHLSQLNIWLTSKSTSPVVGALAIAGEIVEVQPYSITEATAENAAPVYAVGATLVETVTVNPSGA